MKSPLFLVTPLFLVMSIAHAGPNSGSGNPTFNDGTSLSDHFVDVRTPAGLAEVPGLDGEDGALSLIGQLRGKYESFANALDASVKSRKWFVVPDALEGYADAFGCQTAPNLPTCQNGDHKVFVSAPKMATLSRPQQVESILLEALEAYVRDQTAKKDHADIQGMAADLRIAMKELPNGADLEKILAGQCLFSNELSAKVAKAKAEYQARAIAYFKRIKLDPSCALGDLDFDSWFVNSFARIINEDPHNIPIVGAPQGHFPVAEGCIHYVALLPTNWNVKRYCAARFPANGPGSGVASSDPAKFQGFGPGSAVAETRRPNHRNGTAR